MWAPRVCFASMVGVALCLLLSTSVFAKAATNPDCYDATHMRYYTAPNSQGYWYASINTPAFATQGEKANISTGGNPHVYDGSNQHIAVYVSSQESSTNCSFFSGAGCWAQTGWNLGRLDECGNVVNVTTPTVYTELYDDSGPQSVCYVGTYGAAPSYAAYDSRYTSNIGNLHRYDIYYEAPNSGNIENLAYGEYNSQTTEAVAAGEVFSPIDSSYCPVLGDSTHGYWNQVGSTGGGTFATYLNLYVGYWTPWTTNFNTNEFTQLPYLLNMQSSYTQFQVSGGQQ